jgi:hypothetical protein
MIVCFSSYAALPPDVRLRHRKFGSATRCCRQKLGSAAGCEARLRLAVSFKKEVGLCPSSGLWPIGAEPERPGAKPEPGQARY